MGRGDCALIMLIDLTALRLQVIPILFFLEASMSDIIEEIIKLRDNWYETEKATGEVVWGECAYDLDQLIERSEGEK